MNQVFNEKNLVLRKIDSLISREKTSKELIGNIQGSAEIDSLVAFSQKSTNLIAELTVIKDLVGRL